MSQEIKQIVRIGDTDLEGMKPVAYALTKIRGIGISTAYAICRYLGINPTLRLGQLDEDSVRKLDWAVRNLHQFAPGWFVNRPRDPESGKNLHLIGADLVFYAKRDVDLMKKLRSWKGIRHNLGLKVRGQRTRTTGRLGMTVGVTKGKTQAGGGGGK
ncbi:30S ribosomal protein S13 [Vulcanisaeta thermophila]|uniref:30S ribosomal protein S13 n=1 Tax=Vulcanisaeta thermophila TaxID=867917 RepID=UPI0008530322|nr:30S ribosomal protein S13 [Vulcanisaeta thermophila]